MRVVAAATSRPARRRSLNWHTEGEDDDGRNQEWYRGTDNGRVRVWEHPEVETPGFGIFGRTCAPSPKPSLPFFDVPLPFEVTPQPTWFSIPLLSKEPTPRPTFFWEAPFDPELEEPDLDYDFEPQRATPEPFPFPGPPGPGPDPPGPDEKPKPLPGDSILREGRYDTLDSFTPEPAKKDRFTPEPAKSELDGFTPEPAKADKKDKLDASEYHATGALQDPALEEKPGLRGTKLGKGEPLK